jgi:hypothetical protein
MSHSNASVCSDFASTIDKGLALSVHLLQRTARHVANKVFMPSS